MIRKFRDLSALGKCSFEGAFIREVAFRDQAEGSVAHNHQEEFAAMTNLSKIAFLATSLAVGLAMPAFAAGTNRDPDTGVILCKGKSYCDSLKTTCSGIGTYEDATQKDGTVYG